MNANGSYNLSSPTGAAASGECKLELSDDSLTVSPKTGKPLYYSLRDILDFAGSNYVLNISFVSGEKITLSQLGYDFENFLKTLAKTRNELILKDLLMNEKVKMAGIEGQYQYLDPSGKEIKSGICEVRVYDTAVVVLPEKAPLIRTLLSEISDLGANDYKINITSDPGSKIIFSMLGSNFDPLLKGISDATNELVARTQSFIKDIAPQIDPAATRKLASILKEGKAVKKSALDPAFWDALEKRVKATDLKDEYEYLIALAQKDLIRTGIKRGLMGDLTGDYIWFLIPLKNNFIVMEAVNLSEEAAAGGEDEENGKATYFFKAGKEGLEQTLDIIARGLIEINFRREPIYLSDEKLLDPKYSRYRFSILALPELLKLRQLFAGRVIHSSPEQWKEDVSTLLGGK